MGKGGPKHPSTDGQDLGMVHFPTRSVMMLGVEAGEAKEF